MPPSTSETRTSGRWQVVAAWIAAIVAILVLLRSADDSYVHVDTYRDDKTTLQHQLDTLRDQQQSDIQRIESRLSSMDGKLDRLIENKGGPK